MQNLVFLMDPSDRAWETSLKSGNMILNRFCIDEDAAFELSGVSYLTEITKSHQIKKGMEYLHQLNLSKY